MQLRHFAGLLLAAGCLNSNEPGEGVVDRRLAVGEATNCALDPQGTVFCWGLSSNFLEYGTAGIQTSGVPIEAPIPKLVSLSSGKSQHRCGLTGTSAVCWGRGQSGQLGDGNAGAVGNPPATVQSGEKWADISTGRLTSCARNADGDGFCWGLNQYGELGDSVIPPRDVRVTPNRVSGAVKWSVIVAGWLHTCGIATSGTAYCWGNNISGQLGIGAFDSVAHYQPQPVSSTLQFKSISLSARSTCAVSVDGQLFCWGYNGTGQLGVGDTTMRNAPTPVMAGKKFKEVAVGSGFPSGTTSAVLPTLNIQGGIAHACAIDDQDAVYCWGWNGAGQVGDATAIDRLSPVAVSSTIKFNSIALGASHSCGMSGTAIYCWGSNSFGQVGNGSTSDAFMPVKVQTTW